MLKEEIINEILNEYGGEREDILFICDRLNELGIPQDEFFVELVEEIYSLYMSSELNAELHSKDNDGKLDVEKYDELRMTIDDAIVCVFNDKLGKEYETFEQLANGTPFGM